MPKETFSVAIDVKIKEQFIMYLDQHFPAKTREKQFIGFLNYVFKNLARAIEDSSASHKTGS